MAESARFKVYGRTSASAKLSEGRTLCPAILNRRRAL